MRYHVLAAVTAVLSASAAHAGGFTAPVVESAPVVAVEAAPAPAWQGGYAGAALGYAFGGEDGIGLSRGDVRVTTLGKSELSGPNLSLRGGYRWQRGNWVVGPELSYTFGNISDEFDYEDGTFESKVNHMFALKLKTGYLVRPDTMVFGSAGWTKGDFTYSVNGDDTDFDADGYVLGLGVEKMITEKMSVTGEYEYANFGKTAIDFVGGLETQASPTHSNVKVGLNFKF